MQNFHISRETGIVFYAVLDVYKMFHEGGEQVKREPRGSNASFLQP